MTETATAQDYATRKPASATESVGTPDNLIEWISLRLTVTDTESVAELIQKPEGRERDEYALAALRIGILALKHGRGQIDADAVKREGERILSEMKSALELSRTEIHTNLTKALKEYFDPESGRFQERVDRLIKQDGDLEQVLRRQVGNEGSVLAQTLSAHIGTSSPLMKILDPEESKGLVSSIRTAISETVEGEQERILKEFSLDNESGALKRLVTEMTSANGKLRTDLASEIGIITQEFSLDKEDSALSRLVKRVEVAEEAITKEFSLDEKDSALSRLSSVIADAKKAIDSNLTLDNEESSLARLKREIETILNGHQQRAQDFHTKVEAALESMKAQRKESARSTQHGNDFQDAASEFVEAATQKSGDITSRTGLTTGLIKNCRVGDMVIELGSDCSAAGEKFVLEFKEDTSYSMAKARSEIDTARKNRGASVGLFVFSLKTAPLGIESLTRQGDDVFVVWDANNIESDVILRAGLSLSKALCVRQRKGRDAEEGNWDHIDSSILVIEKESNRLVEMKRWTDTIQSNSGKILEEIRKMSANLEREITNLRESVTALKGQS